MQKTPDWIIANHNRKTHGRKFSALLCVSNRRVAKSAQRAKFVHLVNKLSNYFVIHS